MRKLPALFVLAALAAAVAASGSPLAAESAAAPARQSGWPPPKAVPLPAAAAPNPGHPPAPAAEDPARTWARLLEGNRRFVAGRPAAQDLLRRRAELAAGQHPEAVVLGCSDSRVPPEAVFDRGLGDLFVVRTAGHVADEVALGSIEYAVEHLGARVVVVLGHERCGAVAAAAAGGHDLGPNLAAVVGRIAPALQKLGEIVDGAGVADLGVEVNVHRAARDLTERSDVLAKAVRDGRLAIVKAVYRLESGEVTPLK